MLNRDQAHQRAVNVRITGAVLFLRTAWGFLKNEWPPPCPLLPCRTRAVWFNRDFVTTLVEEFKLALEGRQDGARVFHTDLLTSATHIGPYGYARLTRFDRSSPCGQLISDRNAALSALGSLRLRRPCVQLSRPDVSSTSGNRRAALLPSRLDQRL